MIWDIAVVLSSIVFVVTIVRAIRRHSVLDREFNVQNVVPEYRPNKLMIVNEIAKYQNEVYENMNEASNHILDTLMISQKKGQSYLVCNFYKPLEVGHIIGIRTYNANEKLLKTLYVEYDQSIEKTSFIKLPEETKFVNVDIHDNYNQLDKLINFHKRKLKAYRKAALHISIALFFLFIPLGYIMLSSLTRNEFRIYLNLQTISLGFVIMIAMSILNFVFINLWVKVKFDIGGKANEKQQTNL